MQETKQYEDGTMATGEAPLPALSPREQDAADALALLDDIETVQGGSNGPTIRLRGLILRMTANVELTGRVKSPD